MLMGMSRPPSAVGTGERAAEAPAMQRLVFLIAVAVLAPVVADARSYSGTVVLTIPAPSEASLTFGQAPQGFDVVPGLRFTVSGGDTVTITSARKMPLPLLV